MFNLSLPPPQPKRATLIMETTPKEASYEAKPTTRPHIAILPSPGMGHITPLFEFSKLLVTQHGFQVTFLNITTEASQAQNDLLHDSLNLPQNLQVIDLPPVDLSHLVNDQTPVLTHLCINVRESLKCLKETLTQMPNTPQALIIDMFCTQAFDLCKDVFVVNNIGIKIFTFFTSTAHSLAFWLLLPQLDRDVEGEFVDLPEPVRVPGCAPIRIEDLIDQARNRKIDEYKWYLYHLSRVPLSAGIILNTWEDLEPTTLRALKEHPFYHNIPTPQVYSIGPLIKETEPMTQNGSECLAWLDKQPPDSVLFVAFGSGGTLTTQQQNELALGLELSNQRFLWVVRAPSDASASATFFNVGGDSSNVESYLPEGFVERTRGRGLVVVSWAPQRAILQHPSTASFLSHCGWNSLLESVVCGVPLIAWPLYAEQRMNATMAEEEVGVAAKVVAGEGGVVGREEVERVVRMVMEGGDEGKAIKRRAREMKESAAMAMRVGGSSFESLATLINLWKAELQSLLESY